MVHLRIVVPTYQAEHAAGLPIGYSRRPGTAIHRISGAENRG
ncbi:MAG TPA: hypothetical protein VE662_04955 [Solirubrobacterales bacterium]|nr:hypothetical protein [Solirubrobacterales bacterium]